MQKESLHSKTLMGFNLLGTLHGGTQSVGDFLPRYSKTDNGTIADFCEVLAAECVKKGSWIFSDVGGGG